MTAHWPIYDPVRVKWEIRTNASGNREKRSKVASSAGPLLTRVPRSIRPFSLLFGYPLFSSYAVDASASFGSNLQLFQTVLCYFGNSKKFFLFIFKFNIIFYFLWCFKSQVFKINKINEHYLTTKKLTLRCWPDCCWATSLNMCSPR